MTIKKQSYPFIYTNVFITACVDTEDNYSFILLEKINPKTKEVEYSDEISCVHTVVYSAPISELQEIYTEDDFLEKMLDVRSTEFPELLNLTPDENFFALKSWVQGICEAGLDCFIIQSKFEEYLNLLIPLAQKLLSFLIKVEPRVIPKLLHHIKKKCVFEGEPHFSSLNSNLVPIMSVLSLHSGDLGGKLPRDQYIYSNKTGSFIHVNFEEYLDYILELKPTPLLFLNSEYKFLFREDERIKDLPDYKKIEKHYSVLSKGKRFWAYYLRENLILSVNNKVQKISEIQGLENLHGLDFLSVARNGFTMIDGLENVPNISYLSINFNNIRTCDGLEGLDKLKYLSLFSNEIEDIYGLKTLQTLDELNLDRNPIKNLSPLSELVNLRELSLNYTLIEDIQGLESLQNIGHLELGSPHLKNLDGLDELKKLTVLILNTPHTVDVNILNNIPNLKYLTINKRSLSEGDEVELSDSGVKVISIE